MSWRHSGNYRAHHIWQPLAAVGTEQIIHQALNYSSRVTLGALLLEQVQDRIGHNKIHEKSLAIETTFFRFSCFRSVKNNQTIRREIFAAAGLAGERRHSRRKFLLVRRDKIVKLHYAPIKPRSLPTFNARLFFGLSNDRKIFFRLSRFICERNQKTKRTGEVAVLSQLKRVRRQCSWREEVWWRFNETISCQSFPFTAQSWLPRFFDSYPCVTGEMWRRRWNGRSLKRATTANSLWFK